MTNSFCCQIANVAKNRRNFQTENLKNGKFEKREILIYFGTNYEIY